MPSPKPFRLLWMATAAAAPVALLAARGRIRRLRSRDTATGRLPDLALWIAPCGQRRGQ